MIDKRHPAKISRRELTAYGLALALLAGCGRRYAGVAKALDAASVDPTLGAGKRVIVLGSGLAGLSAAYKLQAYGFGVTVLEKTSRIAGRVWTNRGFFRDQQYCEFGATRIPDIHDKTIAYAGMLGLELMPALFGDADNWLYCVNGKRFKKSEVGQPQGPARGYLDCESDYTTDFFAALGDGLTEADLWAQIEQRRLDGKTFRDWLKSDCDYTDEQVRTVEAAYGTEADMASAGMWMAQEYVERNWDASYRIKGGNDQIAHGLSGRLKTPVTLLAEVRGVRRAARGMAVDYLERGTAQTLEADFVVCALPLDVLQRIQWTPALSPAKLEASRSVRMQAVTRINLQFAQRFWETDEGLKGLEVLRSDFPTERLWDMTVSADQRERQAARPPQGDAEQTPDAASCTSPNGAAYEASPGSTPMGILTCYIESDHALAMGKLGAADRIAAVMRDVQRAFPRSQVSDLYVKGNSWVWHQQNWVGGGWAAYAPEQLDLYMATRVAEADGRVFFAGDHTTIETGWMQGALASGERAAEQVVQSVRA